MARTHAWTIFTLLVSIVFPAALTDAPRTVHEYLPEFGAVQGVIAPKHPLSSDIVERWIEIIDASDAQRQFILLMHERFVEEHNDFLDEAAPEYLQLGREAREIWQAEGPNSRAVLDHMRKIDQASARLRQQLISLEHSFIASIETALTAEQMQHAQILRYEVTRRNCRTFRTSTARWVHVELRDLWQATAAEIASPSERQSVEDILAEYESQLTRLVCQRADIRFQLRQQLTANRINRAEGVISPQDGRMRYERLMERRLRASQRIRTLNVQTADRIVAALSEEPAAVFRGIVNRTVYPEVYPDRYALDSLFESLTRDEDIVHTHEFITRQRDQYVRERQRINDDLEATCLIWGDNTEAGITGYEPQFVSTALEPLLDERAGLSRRYLEMLRENLDPDVLTRHADAVPARLRSTVAEKNED